MRAARFVRERIRTRENGECEDARDVLNRRLAAPDMLERGPRQLTVEEAEARASLVGFYQKPTASSNDRRPYRTTNLVEYFPDATNPLARPILPPRSLFQNPWLNNYDIEAGDITRELRGVVRENNRHTDMDASARIRTRTTQAVLRH